MISSNLWSATNWTARSASIYCVIARARALSGHLRYPVAAIVSTRGRVRSVNLSRLIITRCAAMCGGDVFAREQTLRRPAEAAGAVQVI